jgi:hypothetical protein
VKLTDSLRHRQRVRRDAADSMTGLFLLATSENEAKATYLGGKKRANLPARRLNSGDTSRKREGVGTFTPRGRV